MSSIPRNKNLPREACHSFFCFFFLIDLYLSKYEYIHYVHIYKHVPSLLGLFVDLLSSHTGPRWKSSESAQATSFR